MPERVTITNYTDKPVAHPGFTTIMPGQTKTRTQRVVDIDSYSEIYTGWQVLEFTCVLPTRCRKGSWNLPRTLR
jgi:hypothetical protein